MAVLGDLLFYRRDQVDLDHVLRHQVELLRQKVDALPDTFFAQKTDEEIANHIATEAAIEPLQVDFANAVAAVREVQVERRDDFGFDRGRGVHVPGLQATKTIRFKGDKALWHLRTNPFNMNPPHGDVRADTVVVGISVPAHAADEAARYIDETLARIPEYLQRQKAQIDAHNAGLARQAMQWVTVRRGRLSQASDLLEKLGG
jgi:hypothetical protein